MNIRTLMSIGAVVASAGVFWLNPSATDKEVVPVPALRSTNIDKGTPIRSSPPPATTTVHTLRAREELFGQPQMHTDAIFKIHSWAPPPPPVVKVKAVPAPKPVAPPLPFSFLGKKFENGVWEAYLARGNETYVVRDQSLVDGIYRAETVRPPTLTLTYLPLQQVQTLPIGEAE